MKKNAYLLQMPEIRTTSVVFASPHSGRNYPRSFLRQSVLDERTIRSSEDAFVDHLFDGAPAFGAPLLAAVAPRAFVDLNRSSEELDPTLIDGVRRATQNPRVTSGLGVIPRVVANGRVIYRDRIPLRDAEIRLRDYWHPYHGMLHSLLASSMSLFGEGILIDCHSMPHEALESIAHPHGTRPDIVLGDRFGAAAGSEVVDRVEALLASAGLSVIRNAPFAGAFTAQQYGRPSRGQHVIQIEIDRSLYMDEQKILPNRDFEAFKQTLTRVIGEICDVGRSELPVAAE